MAFMKAGAVLAVLVAVGFSVTACQSTTSATPVTSGNMTVVYQTLQHNYLMQVSYPTRGGQVSGSVTVGEACEGPNGSIGVLRYGPFPLSGTYYPNGDAAGNQFEFARSTGDIARSVQEVIADIGGSGPLWAAFDGSGGLAFAAGPDWAPETQSGFVALVEGMWGLGLPACGS
jgi:hypothetical protein